jgi:hypothetical protein
LAARGGELVGKLAAPLLDMASRRSPLRGSGLRGEIAESMRCLRLGMGESPMMPLDETLAVHRILDDARAAAGSPT